MTRWRRGVRGVLIRRYRPILAGAPAAVPMGSARSPQRDVAHVTSTLAMAKYATIDSRSWITVASGPDPNAGSRPSRARP